MDDGVCLDYDDSVPDPGGSSIVVLIFVVTSLITAPRDEDEEQRAEMRSLSWPTDGSHLERQITRGARPSDSCHPAGR